MTTASIDYRLSPPVSNEALNALYAVAWPRHTHWDFGEVLARSMVYVCAYDREQDARLIGFVYGAWWTLGVPVILGVVILYIEHLLNRAARPLVDPQPSPRR